MRLLVIGGNGFIGVPLVRELSNSGHAVAVLHRGHSQRLLTPEVEHIPGDRNDLSGCKSRIQRFSPDVVIDLIPSSRRQIDELTRVVRRIAPRLVGISSMDVYRAWGVLHGVEPGDLEPLPLTEDSPLRSVRRIYPPEAIRKLKSTFTWLDDEYDKISVEEAVRNNSDMAATIVRLPMVYGPGDRLHRLFPLLKRRADGRQVVLLAEDVAAWRAPRGYVDNVAHGIALAAVSDKAAGRIYHVCEEPCLSELDWQKGIAAAMNWAVKFVVLPRDETPKHLLLPGNAAQHIVATSERIRNELGYVELVGNEEAIRRTVPWEEQNPPAGIDPQQFDYASEDAALQRRKPRLDSGAA